MQGLASARSCVRFQQVNCARIVPLCLSTDSRVQNKRCKLYSYPRCFRSQCMRERTVAYANSSRVVHLLRKLDLSQKQQELCLGHLDGDETTYSLAKGNLQLLLDTYNRSRVKQLVVEHPSLLSCSLSEWYSFLQGYGFCPDDIYTLVTSNVAHLTYLQLFNAGQVLMLLQQQGLSPLEIRTSIVMRHPHTLGLSPEHVQSLAVCLQQDLGCTPTDVHQLFLANPKVLSCSIRSDIVSKIQHLQDFGLQPDNLRSWAPACISKFIAEPQESVVGKLQYFSSIGISSGHLHNLLVACPAIWTLAVTDIMDKWTFLTKVMGGGLPDVLRYPHFLEKDLMCCIRPRALLLESLAAGGEAVGQLGGGLGLAPLDLACMLDCDDAEFCRRVGVSMAQYLEFYNALVANQYYGVKAAVDVFDRPEPRRG